MSSKKTVKKTVQKNCIHITAMAVLIMIAQGSNHTFQFVDALNMPKQRVNYHIKNLLKKNLITQYAKGTYELSNTGKKIHATYVVNKKKQLVQLENMRYIAPIISGFDVIMERVRDCKRAELNNGVVQYTGKISDHSVKIITSHKSSSIEITCQKQVGYGIHEIMYDARRKIDVIIEAFNEMTNVQIGYVRQSMSPEWAIPHPMAETMLQMTDSSQIRFGGAVINRSAGRDADWEADSLQQALKIMNIPNDIEEIKQDVKELKGLNKIYNEERSDYPMYL